MLPNAGRKQKGREGRMLCAFCGGCGMCGMCVVCVVWCGVCCTDVYSRGLELRGGETVGFLHTRAVGFELAFV